MCGLLAVITTPSTNQGPSTVSIGWGHKAGGKEEDCQGGGGMMGGGKVKGQLSLRAVTTLGVRHPTMPPPP